MVAVAAYLVIAAGGLLADLPPGPGEVLRASALLLLCAAVVVLVRVRGWRPGRLALAWISLGVMAAVQQAGGCRGFLFPAYFLLLLWAALPSAGGMASEVGLAVGLAEAVSLVAGGSPSGLQDLMGALPPALGGLLPPALFGLAADALVEGRRRPVPAVPPMTAAPRQNQRPAFPVAAARALLPVVRRATGARGAYLLVRHDESLFRLVEALGGMSREAERSLVRGGHPLLSVPGKGVEMEDVDGALAPPWLPEEAAGSRYAVRPVGERDRAEAYIVLTDPREGALQTLSEAATALEEVWLPGGGESVSPEVEWFEAVAGSAASASTVDRAIHSVVLNLHRLMEGATVTVGLLEGEGCVLNIYESLGAFAEGRGGRSMSCEASVAGWVLSYGRPMFRNRMRRGNKALRSLSLEDDPDRRVGSCAAAPLIMNGQVAGVLLLEREESNGFGVAEEKLLRGAAGLLSVTVEKVYLRKRQKTSRSRDGLTGLPTMAALAERLEEEVDQVRRYGRSVSVLQLDIDGFSGLNRRLGPGPADGVVRSVAGLLEELLGGDAFLARTGPDSFATVLVGPDPAEAEAIAESMAAKIAEWKDVPGEVTASVGAAVTHTDRRVRELLPAAEEAVRMAAGKGPGRVHVVELRPFGA
jgi:diguanylate cyclase (GGDEF)-like protein